MVGGGLDDAWLGWEFLVDLELGFGTLDWLSNGILICVYVCRTNPLSSDS